MGEYTGGIARLAMYSPSYSTSMGECIAGSWFGRFLFNFMSFFQDHSIIFAMHLKLSSIVPVASSVGRHRVGRCGLGEAASIQLAPLGAGQAVGFHSLQVLCRVTGGRFCLHSPRGGCRVDCPAGILCGPTSLGHRQSVQAAMLGCRAARPSQAFAMGPHCLTS